MKFVDDDDDDDFNTIADTAIENTIQRSKKTNIQIFGFTI